MNKLEIQQRVLQYGKPLDLDEFEWDEEAREFSSSMPGLVLDFSGIDDYIFNTSSNCIFKTGSRCQFNTDYDCKFITGNHCVFNTGFDCVFKTRDNCIFVTGTNCVMIRI